MTIRLFHLDRDRDIVLRTLQWPSTRQETKCARTEITESITMQCNLHSLVRVSVKQGGWGSNGFV